MPRSGARARAALRDAALTLYGERGYEATTAAEIAEHADVSERTFFRHFADKREVLFDGEAELRALMEQAVAAAPDGRTPLELVVCAFAAAVPLVVEHREVAARRAAVIAVTPALQERALAKAEALTDALAGAVTARGVNGSRARLAAQVGMAAWDHAHRAWAEDPSADLTCLVAAAAADVLALGAP